MAGNSFGTVFRVSTFGESHGPAVGCVIDGCPAGLSLSVEDLERDLARRRPGGEGPAATGRNEADRPEILSGVFEGKTLGTPIAILIRNTGQRPADYGDLRELYRPGHADWTWEAKYGFRDYRGGGRSSGRETAGRVAAGAVAKRFLAESGIAVRAWSAAVAGIEAPAYGETGFDADEAERNPLRIPGKDAAEKAAAALEALKARGDSAGGIAECLVTGMPAGLGEPVFDKLAALLGRGILSIGACQGIQFGAGFAAAETNGAAHNDSPLLPPSAESAPGADPGRAPFATNNAGGILGGISNGMDIRFRAVFKPTASVALPQKTVDRNGAKRDITVRGRHDVCVVPRAVPVVEAMTALVIADLLLLARCSRL
ncbi:MAG: chorismate synthase [Spirochaetaceae bacterium]|jgi:chorismate synthase|nr:chorismate synthase [Spirochaetaceae bacterium]